ncbi:sugar phosphate nucleotidyltransferase [Mucilaginibacter antarcticus]
MLTYGDGVSDVDLTELLKFHKSHGKLCTVTSVQPSGRFGALNITENQSVDSFLEKPRGDGSWINGGFFVCQPEVLNFIENDSTVFEKEPMEQLAATGQMKAFNHTGFWKPMDTLRDKHELEESWLNNKAAWKNW